MADASAESIVESRSLRKEYGSTLAVNDVMVAALTVLAARKSATMIPGSLISPYFSPEREKIALNSWPGHE
jgi:hypothetical protein